MTEPNPWDELAPELRRPTFVAKYHGRCWICAYEVAPGDVVRFVLDDLVHEECSL